MEDTLFAKNYNCLVSGDSISRGVVYDESLGKYSVLEDNYVYLVQKRLRNMVRNVSRFGSTLLRGISKLDKEIEKEHPQIVLIEYGGNDCDFNWIEVAAQPAMEHLPNTDLKLFERSLSDTVEALKAKDIIPVLMTLPPLEADKYLKWVSRNDPITEGNILTWLGSATKIYWWQERYSAAVVKVAQLTGTRWIDIRGAFLERPDFLRLICVDGIHPNREGHELIAKTVLEYISKNLPSLLAE